MGLETVHGITVPFVPIGGVDGLKGKTQAALPEERSFETAFKQALGEVRFSRHAQERLQSRNIELNETDMTSIQQAVEMADTKGARDSLVLLRDLAFIVNVRSRTVVTALDSASARQNVFTNIDSAVVAG